MANQAGIVEEHAALAVGAGANGNQSLTRQLAEFGT